MILLHSLIATHSVVKESVSFNQKSLTTKTIIGSLKFKTVGWEIRNYDNERLFLNKSSTSNHNNKGRKKGDYCNNSNKSKGQNKFKGHNKSDHVVKDYFQNHGDETNGKNKFVASNFLVVVDILKCEGTLIYLNCLAFY